MRRLAALLILAVGLLSASAAFAVNPDEMLKDPALEARARALSEQLRCLVCQNESIDDSNAALAHDIRVLLRERLSAGDTDQQVVNFLVGRYGEFILLKPRFNWHTWLSVAGAAGRVGDRGRSRRFRLAEAAESAVGSATARRAGTSRPQPPSVGRRLNPQKKSPTLPKFNVADSPP